MGGPAPPRSVRNRPAPRPQERERGAACASLMEKEIHASHGSFSRLFEFPGGYTTSVCPFAPASSAALVAASAIVAAAWLECGGLWLLRGCYPVARTASRERRRACG